jgi:3,4-dihydroxy-2-butanone 4-phosphate synthase
MQQQIRGKVINANHSYNMQQQIRGKVINANHSYKWESFIYPFEISVCFVLIQKTRTEATFRRVGKTERKICLCSVAGLRKRSSLFPQISEGGT